MDKASLRTLMHARLRAMSLELRSRQEQKIVESLGLHPQLISNSGIGAFVPYGGEPDIRTLLQHVLSRQGRVAIPRINQLDLYEYAWISNLETDLSQNAHRVFEPCSHLPPCAPAELKALLVPGLAFTPCGKRLGRGFGHMDRLLAGVSGCYTIGVCFSCQIVDDIPQEPHDYRLSEVVFPS